MSSEAMIDRLVGDLEAVRPRRIRTDALVLATVALFQLGLVLWLGDRRSDLAQAMQGGLFWWKLGTCLVLALAGGVAVLTAFDPLQPARRLWIGLASVAAAVLLVAALLIGLTTSPAPIVVRLDMHEGLECLAWSLLLALPVAATILWLARRAAPTRPRAAATAAGVAATGWGAFLFSWSCPHADPLYVLVWYGGTILVGALLARWLLSPALRW
ncbi:MAG: NrsF family protein [Polymorphobacter sp.]